MLLELVLLHPRDLVVPILNPSHRSMINLEALLQQELGLELKLTYPNRPNLHCLQMQEPVVAPMVQTP